MADEQSALDTLPEPESLDVDPGERAEATQLGLTVLHSVYEPWLVGAWYPAGAPGGAVRMLGRGAGSPKEKPARLVGFRQGPGENQEVAPFQSPTLSKSQLSVRVTAHGTLALENVGRLRLVLKGNTTDATEVRPGDSVELGSQLVLLCVERLVRLPDTPGFEHDFGTADPHGFVGESAATWQLRAGIARVTRHAGHVLVLGASGTGKELVARAIHTLSAPKGPLVARNAATLPGSLIDAELFGNARNYPNPGMADRKGLVGAADGGTLFLDEFAELPLDAQTHLLRVLDHGEYQRLGEDKPRRSRFRLVAATNRPLTDLRSDLAARFDFRLELPSLAERREDIPLIARHLLRELCQGAPELAERAFTSEGALACEAGFVRKLVEQPYPTNVRELRQLLWRALTIEGARTLSWPLPSAATADESHPVALGRRELESALAAHNGSLEKTWRALGLSSRHALSRLMKKLGVTVTKQF